jgi:hypothetical protein
MSEVELLACELDAVPENGADPQLIADAAAHLRRLDEVEGDYQRLLEKHNNLHMNHMRLQAECEQLRNALKQLILATKHLGPCPGTLDIAERLLKETK